MLSINISFSGSSFVWHNGKSMLYYRSIKQVEHTCTQSRWHPLPACFLSARGNVLRGIPSPPPKAALAALRTRSRPQAAEGKRPRPGRSLTAVTRSKGPGSASADDGPGWMWRRPHPGLPALPATTVRSSRRVSPPYPVWFLLGRSEPERADDQESAHL